MLTENATSTGTDRWASLPPSAPAGHSRAWDFIILKQRQTRQIATAFRSIGTCALIAEDLHRFLS